MRTSILVLLLGWGAACRDAPAPEPAPEAAADATYTTRGEVKTVGRGLEIHHEAIPDYAVRPGKPTGMSSMTMPFGVSPDVSLAGVAVGSKVAFTFEVRWKADPRIKIVELAVLPPDTELVLSGP